MTTENTEITQKQKPRTLKGLLSEENVKAQFALALPKHLSAERFSRVAITALTRTPKLQECTPESFMKCLLDLSAAGLEPDGRNAHLIPYNNNKAKTVECQLQIDYKGYVELVMRTGEVSYVHADKVCDNDVFIVDCGELKSHVVDYKKDRGAAYAYYAIIKRKDGTAKCEVMTLPEVIKIRDKSQGYKSAVQYGNDHPWISHFDEMAKKTVFKRAQKWVRLSPEVQQIIERDNADYAVAQARNVTPTVRHEPLNPFAATLPAIETETIEEPLK